MANIERVYKVYFGDSFVGEADSDLKIGPMMEDHASNLADDLEDWSPKTYTVKEEYVFRHF